ncbi:Holliday junction resolvase RecU [Bacillus sp. FJAT-45037]|uniref:Holliday junction resolvase RecU n=1 Tax=Bacillus sp. FJAT-45037 TaxID=2011007 RepID=UPI0018E1E21B|nr:Holliday junction resolvase RecU [Bacillus sp. FJAT-45037]
MTIRYPNGKRFKTSTRSKKSVKKSNQITYSNRGMTLEEDINQTNEFYIERGLAVIHKKPTPVQIVDVNYPKRSAAVIKEAYFKQASTTDYNGVYKGYYVDFEAKETKNKTSFPLKNFHDHQILHMKAVLKQKGICFALLRFSISDEVYLLDASYLIDFYENMNQSRKSIRKSDVETLGHQIKIGYQPRIDYLPIIDKIYLAP